MKLLSPSDIRGAFLSIGVKHLFFSGGHQSVILFSADAVSGSRTPLYTGRLHFPRQFLPAFLAVRLDLIGPDFIYSITPETPYLFRIWCSYFSASRATFFKHRIFILTLSPIKYMTYIIGYSLPHRLKISCSIPITSRIFPATKSTMSSMVRGL